MSIFGVLSKHSCPNCRIDLKCNSPILIRYPWYKLVRKEKFNCGFCKIELSRQFTAIDEVLIAISIGSLPSLAFGVAKLLIPIVLLLVLLRFFMGFIFSPYKISRSG